MNLADLAWYPMTLARNLIMALDRLVNVLLLGDAEETVSARMGRVYPQCKFCRFVCRKLSKFDPRHCREAVIPGQGDHDLIWPNKGGS